MKGIPCQCLESSSHLPYADNIAKTFNVVSNHWKWLLSVTVFEQINFPFQSDLVFSTFLSLLS